MIIMCGAVSSSTVSHTTFGDNNTSAVTATAAEAEALKAAVRSKELEECAWPEEGKYGCE